MLSRDLWYMTGGACFITHTKNKICQIQRAVTQGPLKTDLHLQTSRKVRAIELKESMNQVRLPYKSISQLGLNYTHICSFHVAWRA